MLAVMSAERMRGARGLLSGLLLAVIPGVAAQAPEATGRMNRLLRQLGNDEERDTAACELIELGERAVEPLVAALLDADSTSTGELPRSLAILQVLTLLGAEAATAADALRKVAADALPRPFADAKQPDLRLAVAETRASLAPYSGEYERAPSKDLSQPAHFRAWVRDYARAEVSATADDDKYLSILASNQIFAREVAAEVLGRHRVAAAMQPLHDLLIARDARPTGWDACQHNGFVVPMDDEFALAAALAMVRIDPDDARGVVAWGVIARRHPFAPMRRRALSRLGSFGISAGEATADLIAALPLPNDDETIEALKVLSMLGPNAAPALATVEALATKTIDPVRRRAQALANQLRAAGVVAQPVATDQADPALTRIRDLVTRVRDGDDEAVAAVRALGAAAIPALQERLRLEHAETPAAVFGLVSQLGARLDAGTRHDLNRQVAGTVSQTWVSPALAMATYITKPRDIVLLTCAELSLGTPDEARLCTALSAEDPAERVVAARRCGALPPPLQTETCAALRAALTSAHPKKASLVVSRTSRQTFSVDFSDAIRAAAAAALLPVDEPRATWPTLMQAIIRHEDPVVVIAGIERWACAETVPTLVLMLKGFHTPIAVAAATALGRLGTDAAAAVGDLEVAAKRDAEALRQAATTALVRIRQSR